MEFTDKQLNEIRARVHGYEYKLIELAKMGGMIPALIPEFIAYMNTGIKTPVDKVLKCFSEKHNGWTNYPTWYLAVEISNRENIYFWIYNNLKDGSLTAGDVVNILKDGIKHPNAVYNPDALKGWLSHVSKEFNVKYERPFMAINWIEIYNDIKTWISD